MNARQKKTLDALFVQPTPSNIRWTEIVSLMAALGDVDEKRSGSRVAFTVKERTMVTHKPTRKRK
ncbi:MAG: hexulose-6-phosphate isomerase [Gemmatimonadaceae bacterium]